MPRIRQQTSGKREGKATESSEQVMSQTLTSSRYEWSTLNWRKIQLKVFKLQKRIYRAAQRGDERTVRRLQRNGQPVDCSLTGSAPLEFIISMATGEITSYSISKPCIVTVTTGHTMQSYTPSPVFMTGTHLLRSRVR